MTEAPSRRVAGGDPLAVESEEASPGHGRVAGVRLRSRRFWRRRRLLGLAGVIAAGCQVGDRPVEGPSAEESAHVRAVAQPAAAALATGLVAELTRALEERGPEGAVEVCSTEALRLTDQIARDAGTGIELKRVSWQNRNPENAPDDLEAVALEYFQRLADGGEPLSGDWVQSDGERGWRYYKPLVVADFCLQCHGSPEEITPSVREMLAERYPDDAAVGYSEGDLRGLIRVSVPPRDMP